MSEKYEELIEKIGKENYSTIIKMAKMYIRNCPRIMGYSNVFPVSITKSMEYVEDFFKQLNEDYYHRVMNIFHLDVIDDSFITDVDKEYSVPETFLKNNGYCFRIMVIKDPEDTREPELPDQELKNICYNQTGEVRAEETNTIFSALSIVHETGHKIADQYFNNIVDEYIVAYKEIPGITLEVLFTDKKKKKNVSYNEIWALREFRRKDVLVACINLLLLDILLKNYKKNISTTELRNLLFNCVPDLRNIGFSFNEEEIKHILNKDIEKIELYIFNIISYVIGYIMAEYYRKDYYMNPNDPMIFKFIHIYGDNLMESAEAFQARKELHLPLENKNFEELEEILKETIKRDFFPGGSTDFVAEIRNDKHKM